MISSPEKYIKDFKEAGADIITIHYEATDSISNVLKLIKDNEVKCGVSLMPGTSYKVLEDIIHELDLVLVMTVEPGFGGQTFMSDQIQKISFLSQIIKKKNPKCLLAVDGGINDITGAECKKAGANVLVAGSYIFKNKQQITEDNYQEYTSSTSKVARKTSGELAQPILIGEHKRIPKFDVANLEVQEVYMPLVNEELDRRQLTWTRTRSFEPSSGAYIRYVSSTGRRKRRRQLFKLAEYTSNINKLRLC
jgi:pentose-5-phosphate-3-epimerase